MAPTTSNEARAAFLRTFKDTARHQHRYEVWRDFVTMAACSLHNGVRPDEAREAEYLNIIGRYERADQQQFPKLMALLVTLLDEEPRDILGPLYLELEIGRKDSGQFFTPPALSEAMARLTLPDLVAHLAREPYLTLQEPACGAGGMVLAAVKVVIDAGYDPSRCLWVQAVDVDRVAALMCYVQLALWHVPAQVVVGNTLTLETREVWHTPAHYMGFWEAKLAKRRAPPPEPVPDQPPREPPEQLELF